MSDLPIALTFTALAGESRAPADAPAVLPTAAGEALRPFFDAHPAVAAVQFELALNETGDDLEFAGGTLLDDAGRPLHAGREAGRAGDALRRLLRTDVHLAALPVALTIAHGGVDQTFRIAREATGAGPADPAAPDPAASDRAAARERTRLRALDERFDQRDPVWDE